MTLYAQFKKVMTTTASIALATSVDSQPNVRIVSFGYDAEQKNIVYFTSFPDNEKVEELKKNPKVACISLPQDFDDQVQVRLFGEAKISKKPIQDIEKWIKQPDFNDVIAQFGDVLLVYEIKINNAFITIGMAAKQHVPLD